MEIRPALETELREIAELWCDAFPGARSVADRMRMLESGGRYGGLETVRVLRDRGALVGACKLYRLESYLAGTPMPTMGLAAVAVAPAHRRRGHAARLCTDAIRSAADRGDVLSLLYPFRPDYYERLGWGLVGGLHDHRFHTGALPRYPEARRVRASRPEGDMERIAACYERVAARSTGPIRRDRRVWAYRLSDEELGVRPVEADAVWNAGSDPRLRAVVYQEAGADEIGGYALLRYVTRRSRGDNTLVVRELVAESEAAYRGLLGFIGGQGDQWPRARHFARPEERFADRLRDPRPPGHRAVRSLYFPTARIIQGPMLRVLDLPGALRARRWLDAGGADTPGAHQQSVDGGAGTLLIRVADPQRPENEGPWRVRLPDGEVEAVGADAPRESDAGLETDAATFARIFAGEISASDAARLGGATVEGDTALLDRAFATRERFWLLDEF